MTYEKQYFVLKNCPTLTQKKNFIILFSLERTGTQSALELFGAN